jgi:GST-like protein
MSIVFYEAPMSSATPVACALAELGVPHDRVRLDLKKGDQRKPEFLALNPNGKVPTLVVDGTPMFEALAIMMWLGDRYGVAKGLWPAADAPARLQAMSWSTWAYVTYGALVRGLTYAAHPMVDASMHNAAQEATIRRELGRLLDLLEARLASQAYLLGDDFSLTDLIVASVLGYGAMVGASVDAHPVVKAWMGRCQARPSFRSVMGG